LKGSLIGKHFSDFFNPLQKNIFEDPETAVLVNDENVGSHLLRVVRHHDAQVTVIMIIFPGHLAEKPEKTPLMTEVTPDTTEKTAPMKPA
jgi:hypothetical protein